METFRLILIIIGGVSSSAAIVSSAGRVIRHRKQRSTRRRLEVQLYRLRRLSRRTTALAVVLNQKMAARQPDDEQTEIPLRIKGDMIYLDGLILECEETVAYLRSLDADGGLERLRADVERLANMIGSAAEVYRQGSLALGGGPDADGKCLSIVPNEKVVELEEFKREVAGLFRTCGHRYGLEHQAPDPVPVLWPVREGDLHLLPPDDQLWGCEPRPIGWE